MFYNQNIGPEKKECEYKLFAFNPLKISYEESVHYLTNSKFVFNDSVIETINNYIEIYLPKYICSFLNPLSKLTIAELYFGINDDGVVSGIPYIGILDIDFINEKINVIFSKMLKFKNKRSKREVKKCIHVEIIRVNTNNIIAPNNDIYTNYLKETTKINNDNDMYNKKRNVWEKMFYTNILKLYEMINDEETRKVIWQYVKEITNYSKNAFKNEYSHLEKYCDVDNYWDLMSRVKSGYKFQSLKTGLIKSIKQDKLNIYHWIIKWKDSKNNVLKLTKPKILKKKIDINYPIFLLSQSVKMIPLWIKHNENLNVFVIKITFDIKKYHEIEYLNIEKKWKKAYRTLKNNNTPMTLSYI